MMTRTFLFFIFLIICAASCGDDDSSCTAAMIEGTYSGSSICSNSQSTGPTSLSVSANGSTLTIIDQDGTANDVTLDGCGFEVQEQTSEFFGVEIKISANGTFNGATLEYTVDIETDGEKETCTFTGTM